LKEDDFNLPWETNQYLRSGASLCCMICGVDEAGRGPVLGPLVVCGVAVESDARLVDMGVRDSKKLAPRRREELAAEISRVAEVKVIEVSADEIDVARKRVTMNELEAEIFAEVVSSLAPATAYMDAADANAENFRRMVQAHSRCSAKLTARHKADEDYPVVAAASIVAKVTRDRRMREIGEEAGVVLGSGYPSDPVTKAFLRDWVESHDSLPPFARKSWETSQKIMRMKCLPRLESFEG
jgi:ribonuclease HII